VANQEGITLWSKADDEFYVWDGAAWNAFSGGGASDFIALSDTPGSYSGAALQMLRVNAGEDAVEFVDLDADLVAFDNTASGLTATDVQAAIDEIVDGTCALLPYEKGTWTPTMTFDTPGDLSVSYSEQAGQYYQLDDFMSVFYDITAEPTYTTASGTLRINGLPSACVADPASLGYQGPSFVSNVGAGTAITYPTGRTQCFTQTFNGSSQATPAAAGSGVAASGFNTGNIPSTESFFSRGNLTYGI
jgi:hypothetical protein